MKNKKNIFTNKYEQIMFGVKIIVNMKEAVIEIKHYQFKTILIKLDHI